MRTWCWNSANGRFIYNVHQTGESLQKYSFCIRYEHNKVQKLRMCRYFHVFGLNITSRARMPADLQESVL